MTGGPRPVVFHKVNQDLHIARSAYPQEAVCLRKMVQAVPQQYWEPKYGDVEGFDRLPIPDIDLNGTCHGELQSVRDLLGAIAVLPEILGRKQALINRYAPGVNGPFLRNGPRAMPVIIFGLTEDGQLDYYPEGFPKNSQPESIDIGVGDIVSIENPYLLYRGADQTDQVRYSAVFYNHHQRIR